MGWLILGLGLALVFGGSSVQAVAVPEDIRIGVIWDQPQIDFGVSQGNYTLEDRNTGRMILSTVSSGTLIRAQLDPNQALLDVYRYLGTSGEDNLESNSLSVDASGKWEFCGSFKGPLRLEMGSGREASGALNLVKCQAARYRGQLEIRVNVLGNGITAINELPLEEYLYGVVAREMSGGWPLEALRAQAVIARTYAARNLSKHITEGYNLCGGTNCQAYGGYDREAEACTRAVKDTSGQVVVDKQGQLAITLYHSNSGGYTENNVNVFGADLDYLQGRPDPYSLGHGLSDWNHSTVINGVNQQGELGLREALFFENPQVGTIESLELIKYPSGRVQTVIIKDNRGQTIKMTGSRFAELFNPKFAVVNANRVMSRMFDIDTDATMAIQNGSGGKEIRHGGIKSLAVLSGEGLKSGVAKTESSYYVAGAQGKYCRPVNPTTLEIKGHGWGHGVGLSQWGAFGMAQQGFKYEEILSFYYPGTRLISSRT